MDSDIRPLSLGDVEVTDGFWQPRLETNRLVTLEHQYEHIKANGCFDNFRRVLGEAGGEFEGPTFVDANAYKWLEAASYSLATHDLPRLSETVDEVVSLVERAQADDGYLFTYLMLRHPEKRWTNFSMMHELYCAGHLVEAGVAHHRSTGGTRLLDVARRFADHLDDRFGPDAAEKIPGHQEIELALLKLHDVTDDERYLDLARWFIDRRGRDPSPLAAEFERPPAFDRAVDHLEATRDDFLDEHGNYDGRYAQDHRPVREHAAIEGHAVRATNFYTAAARLLRDVDDPALLDAVERVWENMVAKRMYVTGGIGSDPESESFTTDYDLPNDTAFAETCAAAGCVFWGRAMFEATGEARYFDVVERALYNALLAGVSLDGTKFFYSNPLRTDGDHRRKGWLYVACCPPNVSRVLASLGSYVYAASDAAATVYVNLYVASDVDVDLAGTPVHLEQRTEYPWRGTAEFELSLAEPAEFALRFRRPGWADEATVRVDDDAVPAETADGYLAVERTWTDGDRVTVSFPMEPELLAAHPDVDADAGRVAIRRGPLVYCLESVDNSVPVHHVAVDDPASLSARHDESLLGGVTLVEGEGSVQRAGAWEGNLYRPLSAVETAPVEFTAVPYYAWNNRAQGAMTVWLRRA